MVFPALKMLREHQASDHVSRLLRRNLQIVPNDPPLVRGRSSETLQLPGAPDRQRSKSAPASTLENGSLEGSIELDV